MKKFLTSFAVIGSFVVYSLAHNNTNSTSIPLTSNSAFEKQATPLPHSSNFNQPSGVTPTPSQYKDGTYVGSREDAYYGYIQVRATVYDGRLANVQFMEFPNDHHESIMINMQAMPILREEAIQAQSAEVDTVTRATDTSIAFRESLASALSQAEN